MTATEPNPTDSFPNESDPTWLGGPDETTAVCDPFDFPADVEEPPPEPETFDSQAFKFDNGLTNAEVFGSFARVAGTLKEVFDLKCGVQEIDDKTLDKLRREGPKDLILVERQPPTKATEPVEFELLLPNYDQSIVAEMVDKSPEREPADVQGHLEELLETEITDFELELTAIDNSILARVRFAAELDVGKLTEALGKALIAVEVLRPAGRGVEPVELDDELLNGEDDDEPGQDLDAQPGVMTYSNGKADLQPGAIGFEPGQIGYVPGQIGYVPSGLAFHRGILPQPMVRPTEEINAYQRLRWQVAMFPARIRRPVTVAVLDTGMDLKTRRNHPLFAGNTEADPWGGSPDHELRRRNVVDGVFGHGTHVAGLVAQRAPFAGLNHESIRTRAADGSDTFELARDMPDVEQADIFVFSFATPAADESQLPALRQMVDYLLAKGKVIVAAAGTEFNLVEPEDSLYPADFEIADGVPGRLICVGAVDSAEADMIGTRPRKAQIAVKTYGVGVASAFPAGRFRWTPGGPMLAFDGWARWTGTSMAAPRVAGAIASHYQTIRTIGSVVDAADDIVRWAGERNDLVL
ncbi:MAG: S8 family peptidase [Acidimicrobiales bacterium]